MVWQGMVSQQAAVGATPGGMHDHTESQAGNPLAWCDFGWRRQRRLQQRPPLPGRRLALALARRSRRLALARRRSRHGRGGAAAAPLGPPLQRAHGSHQRAAAPKVLPVAPAAPAAPPAMAGQVAARAGVVP